MRMGAMPHPTNVSVCGNVVPMASFGVANNIYKGDGMVHR